MKAFIRYMFLVVVSMLSIYTVAGVQAASWRDGGLLAQAQTNNQQTTAQSVNNAKVPAYYIYSSKYDIALGYNPTRLLVEDTGFSFDISTWQEYKKYSVLPVVGRNLEQALTESNLREHKFKTTEELINAVLPWLKGKAYKNDPQFGAMSKEGDMYVMPFTYKDLDYSALWQAYARKAKNVKLTDYYVARKGAVYMFKKGDVLIGVYAFNIDDAKKELDKIKGIRSNLYVSPKFIKDMEYRIYGTNIFVTLNQRYWITTPGKHHIFFTFYHGKYETKPEFAALYTSTAQVLVVPEEAYKEVSPEYLKESVIAMGASDLQLRDPKLSQVDAKKKAEAKVSQIGTKHMTFYCYTGTPTEIKWGGYKPKDANAKPLQYKQLCAAGQGKTVLIVRATIVKGSTGEKQYNKMLQSFYIEQEAASTASTATPTPVSEVLDGRIHIVPVVKAATDDTEIEPLEIGNVLGPLGTIKLFDLSCINFRVPVNKTTQAARIANKIYTLCGGGSGSGFAVDDTHILSNAHVMSPPPFLILVEVYYSAAKAISAGKVLPRAIDHGLTKDMMTLATAAVSYYQKQGVRFSNYSSAVKGIALRLLKDTVTNATKDSVHRATNSVWATVGKNGYFTIQGDSIILKNSAQMAKVQVLKDYDITPNLLVSVLGSRALSQGLSLKPDLALGKVSMNLKVVPLPIQEESTYGPGTKITVIGYPGLIESSNVLSVKSTYPTVTNGSVTGIKNAAGAKFKIVQISAAVAHGNSGGPVLNKEGKVLGVLTYSFSAGSQDSADLAGAVDIQEARAMLDSQHIVYNKSALTAKVLEAMSEYKKSHFKNAKKLLEEVKQENPAYFGYVLNSVLSKMQLYIDKGLDKSGFVISPEMFGKYLLPAIGGLLVLGLVIVLIKIFAKNRSSNQGPSSVAGETPSAGMTAKPNVAPATSETGVMHSAPQQPDSVTPVQSAVNQSTMQPTQAHESNNQVGVGGSSSTSVSQPSDSLAVSTPGTVAYTAGENQVSNGNMGASNTTTPDSAAQPMFNQAHPMAGGNSSNSTPAVSGPTTLESAQLEVASPTVGQPTNLGVNTAQSQVATSPVMQPTPEPSNQSTGTYSQSQGATPTTGPSPTTPAYNNTEFPGTQTTSPTL